MQKLHPKILEKEGKKQFVVLPYEEFERMYEELLDYQDLKELREAKSEDGGSHTGLSLEEAKKEWKLIF